MGFKTMNVMALFLVLTLNLSALSLAQKPVIHLSSSVPNVNLQIKANGGIRSTKLNPGQEFQVPVDISGVVYFGSAVFGLKIASFHAYDPARDRGHAAIYWKADQNGWSISYDNRSFRSDAPWQSE